MSNLGICNGVCSTTTGDMVCRSCHRSVEEVAHWNVDLTMEDKKSFWDALDAQIVASTGAVSIDSAALLEKATELHYHKMNYEVSSPTLLWQVVRHLISLNKNREYIKDFLHPVIKEGIDAFELFEKVNNAIHRGRQQGAW